LLAHRDRIAKLTIRDRAWLLHENLGHAELEDVLLIVLGGGFEVYQLSKDDLLQAWIPTCSTCMRNKDGIIHHVPHPVKRGAQCGEQLHFDIVQTFGCSFLFCMESVE
jgi:hypothetical protein